ncbi:hypothetical protein [Paenibacillus sp. YN15]|uniref:hypothetical protein n=1 Tax=Paenibacillus sp. YN15 TaxID=1742774 RepID=UPI000DCB8F4D|nr:hypothetical protein [Paenibacillus sp. YN15]RAU96787.1 hypothetical protein DQG13_19705 [Paenibacillus sp. YN15]
MTKKIEVELPVIPREVAEAVKAADDVQTTLDWLYGGDNYNEEHTPALRSIPTATLLRALSVGYEIERTPEEIAAERKRLAEYRLRQRLDECLGAHLQSHAEGFARGIYCAINVLSEAGYENLPQLMEVSE